MPRHYLNYINKLTANFKNPLVNNSYINVITAWVFSGIDHLETCQSCSLGFQYSDKTRHPIDTVTVFWIQLLAIMASLDLLVNPDFSQSDSYYQQDLIVGWVTQSCRYLKLIFIHILLCICTTCRRVEILNHLVNLSWSNCRLSILRERS